MHKLARILEGWDGYQTSLLHAVTPLTDEQLSWRPAPERRSLGELVRRLRLGRVTWLARTGAPDVDAVVRQVPRWRTDGDGARHVVEESVPPDQSAVLAEWLALSWRPIQRVLDEWTIDEWTIDDLFQTILIASEEWIMQCPANGLSGVGCLTIFTRGTDRRYASNSKCRRIRIASSWKSYHISPNGGPRQVVDG